ncbi:MAG: hypothetical protein WCB67_07595, partial [Solirubrobacteraceae bacterium]
GVLRATHAQPRLLLVAHPSRDVREAFWIAGGRLVDSGPIANHDLDQLQQRTEAAVARGGRLGELGAHVPTGEIDEVRILGSWLASHPETAQLVLHPVPGRDALAKFLAAAAPEPQLDLAAPGRAGSGLERELDDDRADLVGADRDV